ncbi:hypothetical protein FQR65_LT12228 [Abscondita terminalis]|nr:hypothetical protein FQR65_LT12228 [Abscondita terminalis]
MKSRANLANVIYCLVSFYNISFGKLLPIIEDDAMNACVSTIIRQNVGENSPLTYLFDETVPIPTQYERKYSVVNINNSDSLDFSSDYHFVVFAKDVKTLEIAMKVISKPDSSNVKMLIVADSSGAKKMITSMWTRKIFNVAILTYEKGVPVVSTSNPFDEINRCGETPNAIVTEKCTQRFRFLQQENFKNCSTGFITLFDYNDDENLMNVVSKYVLTQFERTFNTSVVFENDYQNLTKMGNYIVIMFLTDFYFVENDNVVIFTDDFAWVSPVSKKVTIAFFDVLTWMMITMAFITTSVLWSVVKCFENGNWTWNQMCLSVLDIWCLTLCGCIKTPPSLRCLRLILLIYLFGVVIIHAAFKGNLIKALTVTDYENPIKTINDVANSKLPLTTLDIIENLFFMENISENALYTTIRNKLESTNGGIDQVTFDRNCIHLTFRYFLEEYQAFTNLKMNYFIDNSITGLHRISITLNRGHFFTKSLDTLTQTLIESGVYSKVLSDFDCKYYSKSNNDDDDDEEKEETSELSILVGEILQENLICSDGEDELDECMKESSQVIV